MKKQYAILLICTICVLFILAYFNSKSYKSVSVEAMLVKTFNDSGAKIFSTEVYYRGKIIGNKDNFDKLKIYADNFAKEMGVIKNDSYRISEIRTASIRKIEVYGTTNKNRVVDIILQPGDGSNANEKTITASMIDYASDSKLEEMKRDAISVFRKHNIDPSSNFCITGSIDGKLDSDRLNGICKQMLEESEAEKISAISDRNLISVSAYSHFFGDSIKVSGKKINLNLAIRYNSLEDKTYVWLATPVINIEY